MNGYYHKQKSKNIEGEIHRDIQKRSTEQIINQLKKLKRLNRSSLVKKENISQKELDEPKRLSNLPTNMLKKLSHIRNN